jgi:hypothetical protein
VPSRALRCALTSNNASGSPTKQIRYNTRRTILTAESKPCQSLPSAKIIMASSPPGYDDTHDKEAGETIEQVFAAPGASVARPPPPKPERTSFYFFSGSSSVNQNDNAAETNFVTRKAIVGNPPQTTWRHHADDKVIGLKNVGMNKSTRERRHQLIRTNSRKSVASGLIAGERSHYSVEEMEEEVRAKETRNPCTLFYLGNLAALKVMVYYLSTCRRQRCFALEIHRFTLILAVTLCAVSTQLLSRRFYLAAPRLG